MWTCISARFAYRASYGSLSRSRGAAALLAPPTPASAALNCGVAAAAVKRSKHFSPYSSKNSCVQVLLTCAANRTKPGEKGCVTAPGDREPLLSVGRPTDHTPVLGQGKLLLGLQP
eukprot:7372028-Pyramimonas_sp.AAC.2